VAKKSAISSRIAGTRFLDYAERLLALQREVKRELAAPEQLPLSLHLGGIVTVLHIWLIPLVESLKARKPHLEFELTIEMPHVLVFAGPSAAGWTWS